jgi:MFS family permease
VFGGFLFSVSVTAQSGLGLTALQTGWLMAPFALGGAVGALSSPLLVLRWGPRSLTFGMAVFAIAVAGIAALIHPASGSADLAMVRIPVFLAGAGMGCFAAPLPALMMAGVTDRITGSASGTVPTLQQLGASAGVVALGGLFFHRLGDASPGVGEIATARTYLVAFTTVLWVVAVVATALTAVTLAMPHHRDRSEA